MRTNRRKHICESKFGCKYSQDLAIHWLVDFNLNMLGCRKTIWNHPKSNKKQNKHSWKEYTIKYHKIIPKGSETLKSAWYFWLWDHGQSPGRASAGGPNLWQIADQWIGIQKLAAESCRCSLQAYWVWMKWWAIGRHQDKLDVWCVNLGFCNPGFQQVWPPLQIPQGRAKSIGFQQVTLSFATG